MGRTVTQHNRWRMKEGLTDAELGWAAGILDGEGCIGIYGRAGRRTDGGLGLHALVSVGNTDFRMILKLKDLFGGNISSLQRDSRPNRRAAITWRTSGRHAGRVLERVLPFLVVKREQAEVALAFIATMRMGGRLSQEVKDERDHLRTKAQSLKRFDFSERQDVVLEFGRRSKQGASGG